MDDLLLVLDELTPEAMREARARRFEEAARVWADQDRRPPEFVCPVCGAESWNPNDRKHGYCGRCHDYAADPD